MQTFPTDREVAAALRRGRVLAKVKRQVDQIIDRANVEAVRRLDPDTPTRPARRPVARPGSRADLGAGVSDRGIRWD